MTEYFSWETLATTAGATLCTTMVTQYVKQIEFLKKIPTQVISYLVALIVLVCGTAFTSGLTLQSGLLCVVNAIIIAIASNGTYDNLTELLSKK